jgi:hypothetical protein
VKGREQIKVQLSALVMPRQGSLHRALDVLRTEALDPGGQMRHDGLEHRQSATSVASGVARNRCESILFGAQAQLAIATLLVLERRTQDGRNVSVLERLQVSEPAPARAAPH